MFSTSSISSVIEVYPFTFAIIALMMIPFQIPISFTDRKNNTGYTLSLIQIIKDKEIILLDNSTSILGKKISNVNISAYSFYFKVCYSIIFLILLFTMVIMIKYFIIMFSVSISVNLLEYKNLLINILQLSFLSLLLTCSATLLYSLVLLNQAIIESEGL